MLKKGLACPRDPATSRTRVLLHLFMLFNGEYIRRFGDRWPFFFFSFMADIAFLVSRSRMKTRVWLWLPSSDPPPPL